MLFRRKPETPRPGNTTALILAGGASSRFGSDKGLAVLDGRPLVSWVATAAAAVARRSVLVLTPGASHEPWREAVGGTNAEAALSIVHDDVVHQGPVSGLHAAAPHIETPFVMILAVDMPLVRPDLLAGLMQRLSGHDAVAFHLEGWWRPLPSLWRTDSLGEALSRARSSGVHSLRGLSDILDTRPLGEEFLHLFSDDGFELKSINTPDDLRAAEARLAEMRRAADP